ncbi:hypothetical protein PCASD_16749 [Puccinia coronata f. sp. avenae]|uniref:AB hydrolase-1 domain-containing protein n=1 Tax=Puccinia coronata f. sp. avenae TaxID=200324 RepID=A0A2N5TVX1_9BASI|nr:hypothetical protein PCASD_16749 [Puccinia coronata f. sp. avenae]
MGAIQDPEIFTFKTLKGILINAPRRIAQHQSCFVFTDSAFSWRYQIVDLVSRGYRVIAPDLLGFGGTSKPKEVEAYGKAGMCKSLIEILEHEGVKEKITIVSHDWGSIVAARFLTYHPEKVELWVTLCVPPTAPGQLPRGVDYLALIRKHIPQFGYQIYFMSEQSGEEVDRHCQTGMLLLYFHMERGLEKKIEEKLSKYKEESFVWEGVFQKQLNEACEELESVTIEDPEIAYFVSEMKQNGLAPAFNWYRARMVDQKDEEAAQLPVAFSSDIPCLFIGAPKDPACPPGIFTEASKAKLFPNGNIECINIEGANHFLCEAPAHRAQVTKTLGDWIENQQKHLAEKAHSSPKSKTST